MIALGPVPRRPLWSIPTHPAAAALLKGFNGVLQVDGYDGYNILARPDRAGGPVTLAYCWSHLRRKFYEIAIKGPPPEAALFS